MPGPAGGRRSPFLPPASRFPARGPNPPRPRGPRALPEVTLQGGRTGRGAASDGAEWQPVGPRAPQSPGSSRLPGSPLPPTSRPRAPRASSTHKCQRTAAAPMLRAGCAGCGRAGHRTHRAAAQRALLSAASSATARAPEPPSRRAGLADSRALIGPQQRGAELRGRLSSGRRVAWPAGVWAHPLSRGGRQVGGGSPASWGRGAGRHPGRDGSPSRPSSFPLYVLGPQGTG